MARRQKAVTQDAKYFRENGLDDADGEGEDARLSEADLVALTGRDAGRGRAMAHDGDDGFFD